MTCSKLISTATALLFAAGANAQNLTMEQARERAARVGDVAYAVELELDGERPEFSGTVEISFELADPSADLRVDFVGGTVAAVSVNRERAETRYNGAYLMLPATSLARGANVVTIAFSHPYSNDGSGLYRFRDPEDGRDYLYTDFEPYDQNKVFPSFDQPDLKARFTTTVTAPSSWVVIANVAEADVARGQRTSTWTFPTTVPMSTYIYALHAGEYVSFEDPDAEIPSRLFARASLAEYVDREDWFRVTRQGFAFFESYFDVPYPFGKYDQIIVPHFNAGAMENAGAVTFSEAYLRRGAVTRAERRRIANVILHEMAHMWFGDLVTMQWWNDLWLNESFATFMATLAMAEGTEFTEAWDIAYRDTVDAYRADERPTTHAIELPVGNTDDAFANFDAITYEKGQATLTQLNHLVGPEAFREGVSAYLKRHAYRNTTLADFLGAISEAANRDLTTWAREWLGEPGTNGVEAELRCANGRIESLALVQTAPEAWPTLRTHRTQLGLHTYEDGRFSTETVPVTYSGRRTEVPAAAGLGCPDLVYANHGDWDYARVELDPDILDLLDGRIASFDATLTRSMLWQSLWDMTLDARLSIVDFVEFALGNLEREPDDTLTRQVLGQLQTSLRYLTLIDPEGERFGVVRDDIEAAFWAELRAAAPGTDRQVFLFDNYVAAVSSEDGRARLLSMLEQGRDLPAGFDLDQDRRWNLIAALTAVGHPERARLLEAERIRDASDQGRRRALAIAAAAPDRDAKARFIDELFDPSSDLALAEARAVAGGLFPSEQAALQLEYAPSVLERLPELSRNKAPELFSRVVGGLLGPVCDAGYLTLLDARIEAAAGLHPVLLRDLKNVRFEVQRCLDIEARLDAGA